MTRGREAWRRALIWALLALWLACGIALVVATGEFWPLAAWGGYAVVGAVILHARPGNVIGRILLAIGLFWSVGGTFLIPAVAQQVPVWFDVLWTWSAYPVWLGLAALVLLFPDGRIRTRLGRVLLAAFVGVVVVSAAAVVVSSSPLQLTGRISPLAWPPADEATSWLIGGSSFVLVPAGIGLALVDLIMRWRHSTGAERLQYRWLVYGVAVTVAVVVVLSTLPELPEPIGIPVVMALNAIPISIGIAVTRHGLYEIGRVISRTVSYLLVTALAVGVYALVVTSVSWWLPGLPALGVALATLAAAALCWPALRWVQRRLDRRFDRERYDAEKVVDAFGRRLRDGADPASTAPELVATVEQALQPASVGVWVSGGAR